MSMEPEIAEKTAVTSELSEHRWAVISERGCEATRLPYEDARRLGRSLRESGVRGICVITETAASHLSAAKVEDPQTGR